MKILIAFDKFKGALSSAEAVHTASEFLQRRLPSVLCWTAPISDGGEEFSTLICSQLEGELHPVRVSGPRFKSVTAHFALVPWRSIPVAAIERLQLPASARDRPVAFIDLASASGYELLSAGERDPWRTTTHGTGQLLREAAKSGAGAIVIGIGGSATNDCGTGALEALGVVFYDRELQPVEDIVPAKFSLVNSLGGVSHLLDAFPPLRIACDVSNPLVGAQGATRVFGPQKGLPADDTERMERALQKMGCRLLGLFGKPIDQWDKYLNEPGSGAAGGIGFALRHAFPDSQFVEGFSLVHDLLGLGELMQTVDCLITGEGRLDESSLAGKAPVELLRRFGNRRRAVLLAGSVDAGVARQLTNEFPRLEIISLSPPEWPLEEALQRTPDQIEKALAQLFCQ